MTSISSKQLLHLGGGFEPIPEGEFIGLSRLQLTSTITSHIRSWTSLSLLSAYPARKFTSSASFLPLGSFIRSLVALKQTHETGRSSTHRTLRFALLLLLLLYHLHSLLPQRSNQLLIRLNLLHQTLLQRGLLHHQHLLQHLDLFSESAIIYFQLFLHFIHCADVFYNFLFFFGLFVNFVQHFQYFLSLAIDGFL